MRFGKLIEDACKRRGVPYQELARALRRSQPWALHVIRSENLTERIFKECAWALDMEVEVRLVNRRKRNGKRSTARRAARKARGSKKTSAARA